MSAESELTGLAVRHGVPGLLLRAGLDAYRAEVLREAAQRQRDAAHIVRLVDMDVEQAVRVSADLIDPDKS